MNQLTTALAAVAALSAGADRLIAANAANATALAQAQADRSDADAAIVAALQPVLDKVNAAAPAPVADDTGTADSGVVDGPAPVDGTVAV